jgi:hypothetical protein
MTFDFVSTWQRKRSSDSRAQVEPIPAWLATGLVYTVGTGEQRYGVYQRDARRQTWQWPSWTLRLAGDPAARVLPPLNPTVLSALLADNTRPAPTHDWPSTGVHVARVRTSGRMDLLARPGRRWQRAFRALSALIAGQDRFHLAHVWGTFAGAWAGQTP